MAISGVLAYCANCGSPIKLSVRPSLGGIPSRVPSFCSEQCARAYLFKDELSSLR
jgi:hypothetical protein